jgi:Icc-related predicted phosphoesterase
MRIRKFGPRNTPTEGTRLFFATDVHGSDRCFRKFVNAGRHYGVDAIILGGDITGKALVPIERIGDSWHARVGDHDYHAETEDDLRGIEQAVRENGQYPVVGDREELLTLHDEARRKDAFRAAVDASIRRWVSIAEERLVGTGIRCFVTPGNDDFLEVDEALQGSSVVEFVEGRCVRLDRDHEMITTGYSNPTPWHTDRELDEAALGERITAMAHEVTQPEGLIAVLHAPPFGTSLDQAPDLTPDLRVRMEGGAPTLRPVGSTAVRKFIEDAQPLLGLHGHVHDSKGVEIIGRTTCLNPGSEYTEGVLAGAIVTLGPDTVLAHQFVTG